MNYKPEGFHAVTANATYKDTKAAIEFYERTLNLTVCGVLESPQGCVMHACVSIGDSKIFMNDEFEGSPRKAPEGNASVSFYLYVPDVDQSYRHAVEGGMTPVSEPEEMFWGDRTAVVNDPFGYSWTFSTQVKKVSGEEIEKQVAAMAS
ncbi:MAG: glyoxalase/bleomycin resistance/extradiol dioxygenase family protein [Thermosynechococcaceae cyanobacterium]